MAAGTPSKGFISQLPLAVVMNANDFMVIDQLVSGQPVTKRAPFSLIQTLLNAIAAASVIYITIKKITTQTYTLVIGDAVQTCIQMAYAGAGFATITIPPFSSVAFAVGTNIIIEGYGVNGTFVAPGAGVTIRSANASLGLRFQYSSGYLLCLAQDEWLFAGDIA